MKASGDTKVLGDRVAFFPGATVKLTSGSASSLRTEKHWESYKEIEIPHWRNLC